MPCLGSDLAQHVCGQQVVLVLEEAYGGDGRLPWWKRLLFQLMVPPAALPQVDAEDLP